MEKNNMIKYILIAIMLISVVIFASCSNDADTGGQNDPIIDSEDSGNDSSEQIQCDLNQLRYTEIGPEGEFSIFLDSSYERIRYVVHHEDGTSNQYYVSKQLFVDLYSYINEIDLQKWKTLDSEDVEEESDTSIKIEYRINGMTLNGGSQRMPKGGIAMLQRIKTIAASYESDGAETKPFKVVIAGKEYWTVSGTGNSVGTGAEIDFGDDRWWVVEGFVGHYELTEYAREEYEREYSGNSIPWENASLEISEDGTVVLIVDEDKREGCVDSKRLYGCYATAAGSSMSFSFITEAEKKGKGAILEFRMDGLPYPETFSGYELFLEKQNK